jgi:hypothetical protein
MQRQPGRQACKHPTGQSSSWCGVQSTVIILICSIKTRLFSRANHGISPAPTFCHAVPCFTAAVSRAPATLTFAMCLPRNSIGALLGKFSTRLRHTNHTATHDLCVGQLPSSRADDLAACTAMPAASLAACTGSCRIGGFCCAGATCAGPCYWAAIRTVQE